MKHCLIYLCLLIMAATNAQTVNIIPRPASLEVKPGNFSITPSTRIVLAGSGLEKTAAFFNDYLKKYYGFQLSVVPATSHWKNAVVLNYDKMENSIPGAYHLTIDNNKVYIGGDNTAGVFYGIQSLIRLLPFQHTKTLQVPQLMIIDSARFAYRGAMLDCGRHFFDVAFVKKYIDLLASYKLNTFHWHLTEDQGWRIEIKKYPNLTKTGAYRNGTIIGHYPGTGNDHIRHGGFYTQAQIKEIVQYAANRFITVIPEIEMPGHSSAALAAYPELGCTGGPYQVQQTWGVFNDVYCAGNEKTFQFLQDVLDEIIPLFPSKYIHIGGDECPKVSWKACPKCQQRMKDNQLADEHALQSYFISRMEKYLNSKGKQIIGWDEILEGGLAPNATVMSWRGEQGGIEAARQHHFVVMTPGSNCYLDHAESKKEDSVTIGGFLPIQNVYSYEPVSAKLNTDEGHYILGAQANVWTEYMGNPAKVEYMVLPRLSAMSEVLWTPKDKKDFGNFEPRMLNEMKRYDWLQLNYNKAFIHDKPAAQ